MKLKDIHKIIQNIEYSAIKPYRIQSAKKTLKLVKGHCLDGALVAAYLMEYLGYSPNIIDMHLIKDGNIIGHAIYVYKQSDGYRSIGKSRHPELESRNSPYLTLNDLVKSYYKGYRMHGYDFFKWGAINLTDMDSQWKDGNILNKKIFDKHRSKFSQSYHYIETKHNLYRFLNWLKQ